MRTFRIDLENLLPATRITYYTEVSQYRAVVGFHRTAAIDWSVYMIGGLAAVVYTDVIQCFVIHGLFCCHRIELSCGRDRWSGETVHGLGDQYQNHFLVFRGYRTPHPGRGFVRIDTGAGSGVLDGNQSMVQRIWGALRLSQGGVYLGLIWHSSPESSLWHITPISPDPTDSALRKAVHILPAGLLGIFFASFLAAFMASVDSSLTPPQLCGPGCLQRLIQPDRTERHYLLVTDC